MERVGHPTQKPLELIRRFVKSLSAPGALVLDFFAGSGTTGRVCIEEGRNSILVDNDKSLLDYFEQHEKSMHGLFSATQYEVLREPDLKSFLENLHEQSHVATDI